MSKIYLAGPLFCASERAWNETVTELLERRGYEVFLPQRDGMLAAALDNLTEEEKVAAVFEKDTAQIRSSDVLVMVTDGRVPDEGACVELGMAYAEGKRCYGVRTDARALERGLGLNPLAAGCFLKVFANEDGDALLAELDEYLKTHEL